MAALTPMLGLDKPRPLGVLLEKDRQRQKARPMRRTGATLLTGGGQGPQTEDKQALLAARLAG